jgi:hypothetical protein
MSHRRDPEKEGLAVMSRLFGAFFLALVTMLAAYPARSEPCHAIVVDGRLIVTPLLDDFGRRCDRVLGVTPRAVIARPSIPAAGFTTGSIGPFTTGEIGPFTTFSNSPPEISRRR